MSKLDSKSMFILGVFIFFGLSALGYFISDSLIKYKQFERTVKVKGLSQKEYKADVALWPIKFIATDNNLDKLYETVDENTNEILSFLEKNGIKKDEITVETPSIIDKLANEYGDTNVKYRYYANRTINIYSKNIDTVREVSSKLVELGKKGILFKASEYDTRIEYIFSRLNEIKPMMIEEATKKAREVAQKFAKDSKSKLGKIKKASQGQFSISSRDKNTEYIKKIRVVSTVEYYLSD